MEITYVCAQTKKQVVSPDGSLPEGWVFPAEDLSSDVDKPVPAPHTIIAFCGETALKQFKKSLLERRMMGLC